jgi:hypothetical protein
MAIQAIGMKAYTQALNNFTKAEKNLQARLPIIFRSRPRPKLLLRTRSTLHLAR